MVDNVTIKVGAEARNLLRRIGTATEEKHYVIIKRLLRAECARLKLTGKPKKVED